MAILPMCPRQNYSFSAQHENLNKLIKTLLVCNGLKGFFYFWVFSQNNLPFAFKKYKTS